MLYDFDGLDEKDLTIISLLEKDARLSYSDIADEVGLSRVAAKNRVKALEEKGIIIGYKAIINTTASDTGIRYLLIIEAEPDKFYDVIGDLAYFKSNRQIYTGTGESRIIVIGYAKDSKTLAEYMDEMYRNLKGVRKIACQQLVVTHKDADRGVAYERGKVISEN